MKTVTAFLVILVFGSTTVYAQRYNITPEQGQTGLLYFGLMLAVVALITLMMYWRQKQKSSK